MTHAPGRPIFRLHASRQSSCWPLKLEGLGTLTPFRTHLTWCSLKRAALGNGSGRSSRLDERAAIMPSAGTALSNQPTFFLLPVPSCFACQSVNSSPSQISMWLSGSLLAQWRNT
jgi:hypothetical protein